VVSWTATSTLVVLATSALLLLTFVLVEARAASHPLVPLRLFRVRSVTGANLVMFCFGVGMFAMWFFLSLYLQQVLGYSPVVTGVTFLPQTVAIAVGATLSGRLAPKLGPRNVLMLGALLGAAGLFWLSFIQAGDTYWSGACGGGILATFGMGLAFTPIALLATGGVPHEDAGLASGLVNCSRQIGASVGLAALTTLAASRTASILVHGVHGPGTDALEAAMTEGYARAFLVASVVVLAGGLLGFVIPPPRAPSVGWGGTDATQESAAVLID
jgi:predicted MFS family arabinose efflux permease